MKRSLFFILFIIPLNYTNIITFDKNLSTRSWDYNYFTIKEFYNLITSSAFFNNPKKWDEASIACCKCHKLTSSGKLWAYCMAYRKKELLQKLLSIFNNGSTEDLALFTLKTYTELQKKCLNCFQYSGYYIPEELSSSQN